MLLTVVDAFTDYPFSGNPAAVAVLDQFPSDERMQLIAREMNLSETAFVVHRDEGGHHLRWFTPVAEVDLCGHATLAATHVLGASTVFQTRSGPLGVRVQAGWIEMDFPSLKPAERPLPTLPQGFASPVWTGIGGDDWLLEMSSSPEVTELVADQAAIAALGGRAVIVTARAEPGSGADIISRVFGPNVGIPEDPVTGSAHCALAPFWVRRLGKNELTGYQASKRGGTVRMRLSGDRVQLFGQAVTVSKVSLIV
jgi:predicted PhzF superfamily epimerase YddE/YHI9